VFSTSSFRLLAGGRRWDFAGNWTTLNIPGFWLAADGKHFAGCRQADFKKLVFSCPFPASGYCWR
jgi:hypothetical protein